MQTISFPEKVSQALNFVFAIRDEGVRSVAGVSIPVGFDINNFIPNAVRWGDEKKVIWDGVPIQKKHRFVVTVSSGRYREITLFLTYQEQRGKFLIEAVCFNQFDNDRSMRSSGEQPLLWVS